MLCPPTVCIYVHVPVRHAFYNVHIIASSFYTPSFIVTRCAHCRMASLTIITYLVSSDTCIPGTSIVGSPRSRVTGLPYTTVYWCLVYHPPWVGFPWSIQYLHSWTSAGATKGPRWKNLAESFAKTCRSVLAQSCLSSNRAWKTDPVRGV